MEKQPWIGKPVVESIFILFPPFLSLLIIALFPDFFLNNKDMPETAWIIIVLLIDVAHVYSTLYRTYFDPQALQAQRFLLWTIPAVGFIAGVLLYSVSSVLFWRILAYVAVFHFVRQQYGFMRVYSRYEKYNCRNVWIDKITIYAAALYPLAYWHLSGPRNFNWFIENDFIYYQSGRVLAVFTILYIIVIVVYIIKEIYRFISTGRINLPKFLVIAGTIASWYFGIVYFNGDMAFTLLNVVSHGIPYMALIWLYGRKKYISDQKTNSFLQIVFGRYGIVLFLLLIFLFAFVEEGLWDMAVWRERGSFFHTNAFGDWQMSDQFLSIIVPLLALPQLTHYILDGFIWKIKEEEFRWNNEV